MVYCALRRAVPSIAGSAGDLRRQIGRLTARVKVLFSSSNRPQHKAELKEYPIQPAFCEHAVNCANFAGKLPSTAVAEVAQTFGQLRYKEAAENS